MSVTIGGEAFPPCPECDHPMLEVTDIPIDLGFECPACGTATVTPRGWPTFVFIDPAALTERGES